MKKYLPYILAFLGIIISTFVWDLIKFPYDNENLINGNYSANKINPLNDTIRGLFFIFFPLVIYIIAQINFNKSNLLFSLNTNNENFIRQSANNIEVNIISLIIFIFIIFEFFSLNYQNFISKIDVHHEGTLLSAPVNYYFKNKLWLGTHYDYGFIGNNISIFFSYIFGEYNIGVNRFSKIGLILLNKFLIILLCRKIVINISEFRNKGLIFFIFCLSCLSLASFYEDVTPFHQRIFVFLIFFLFLIEVLTSVEKNKFISILVGLFSSISILFYIDIGTYINALILLTIIFLLYQKDFKNMFYIFLGSILSWLIFYLIIPNEEINEFIYQYIFIINVSDYLLGIEFPKPFSDGATRHTKALLMIIISGIFLFNYLFNKKINETSSSKVILLFIFVSSVIFFKSGLMRSDGPHIKYTSGFYTFVILFFIYYYLYKLIKNNKVYIKIENFFFQRKYLFSLVVIILCAGIFLKNSTNIKNIFNLEKNFYALTNVSDDVFLTSEYKEFIEYFKKISINDDCVQQFTDDNSLPYFLNKPTCTQFYVNSHIINGWTEKKFINQLKKSNPEYIIYTSEINWFKERNNAPNAEEYILNNYYLFNKYKYWQIYKKN